MLADTTVSSRLQTIKYWRQIYYWRKRLPWIKYPAAEVAVSRPFKWTQIKTLRNSWTKQHVSAARFLLIWEFHLSRIILRLYKSSRFRVRLNARILYYGAKECHTLISQINRIPTFTHWIIYTNRYVKIPQQGRQQICSEWLVT